MGHIMETNMTLEFICRIFANSNINFCQILDIAGISTKSDLFPASGFHILHPVTQLGIKQKPFFPSKFLILKISKPNLEFRVIGLISDEDDRLLSGDGSDE
jgi:hypothetical protein